MTDRTDVYVKLTDQPIARTREVSDNVLIDLDNDGQIVGVEILGALSVTTDGTPIRTGRRGNHITGSVTGTVVQAGDIHGAVNLS